MGEKESKLLDHQNHLSALCLDSSPGWMKIMLTKHIRCSEDSGDV